MDRLLLLLIFAPIGAGMLAPLLGRIHRLVRDIWVLVIGGAALGLSIFLVRTVAVGGSFWAWRLPVLTVLPTPLVIVDRVGVFLSVLFALVFFLIAVYSIGSLKGYPHESQFSGLFLVLLGGVTGIVFAANLLVLYFFWELVTIAVWRLVGIYRPPASIPIAKQTFLLSFFGSVLMLGGFAALYLKYRTFTIFDLSRLPVAGGVGLLILAGIIVKSASLPLYAWFADTDPAAPAPVGALVSGIVAKIGLVVYLRIFVQGVATPHYWAGMVAAIAIAGALVAAGCALVEKDLKRVLAFSTISQMGYIFIGLGLCSFWGVVGGLSYLAAHCLAKAGLSLAFGIVERQTHERNVDALGGLIHTMPVTGVSTFMLSLSIIGIPPLLGFFSKLLVIIAAAQTGIVVAAALVLIAIFTLVYFLRVFRTVFLGAPAGRGAPREPKLLTGVVVAFAALSIVFGLGVGYLIGFFNHFGTVCSIF